MATIIAAGLGPPGYAQAGAALASASASSSAATAANQAASSPGWAASDAGAAPAPLQLVGGGVQLPQQLLGERPQLDAKRAVGLDVGGDRAELLARDAGVVEHPLQRRVLGVDRRDQRRLRAVEAAGDGVDGVAPEGEHVDEPEQPRHQGRRADRFRVVGLRRRGEQAVHGGDVGGVVAARVDAQEERHALLGQLARAVEHRRDHLGEGEDAAERADRVAGEAARIARAVETLVVLEDRAHDLLRVLGKAVDEQRRRQRMDVDRPQLVAAQAVVGIEQVGLDVQHAQVVHQAGRGRLAHVGARAAALAHQMRAKQGHQDAVVEQRRPRLARERHVQRDRLGQAHRRDRIEQQLAGRAVGDDAREERPAGDRRARRRLEAGGVYTRPRIDALVERCREPVRDELVVQALVDRHAAFEQLDALGVVDRLRGPDRARRAELRDRLHERRRGFAAGLRCLDRDAVVHRAEANTSPGIAAATRTPAVPTLRQLPRWRRSPGAPSTPLSTMRR